jgi:hypothetical protein
MRARTLTAVLAAALLLGACAAPRSQRAPSRQNLEKRVALTARLVEIQEQHLAYVKTQFQNGVAPQTDVSAAEIALVDAQLRHLAAEALLEMSD